ncbi:MAG: hypothetical protein WCE63_17970 [Acidobacteriaceae bacterium]
MSDAFQMALDGQGACNGIFSARYTDRDNAIVLQHGFDIWRESDLPVE